jgi:hypothetical protein
MIASAHTQDCIPTNLGSPHDLSKLSNVELIIRSKNTPIYLQRVPKAFSTEQQEAAVLELTNRASHQSLGSNSIDALNKLIEVARCLEPLKGDVAGSNIKVLADNGIRSCVGCHANYIQTLSAGDVLYLVDNALINLKAAKQIVARASDYPTPERYQILSGIIIHLAECLTTPNQRENNSVQLIELSNKAASKLAEGHEAADTGLIDSLLSVITYPRVHESTKDQASEALALKLAKVKTPICDPKLKAAIEQVRAHTQGLLNLSFIQNSPDLLNFLIRTYPAITLSLEQLIPKLGDPAWIDSDVFRNILELARLKPKETLGLCFHITEPLAPCGNSRKFNPETTRCAIYKLGWLLRDTPKYASEITARLREIRQQSVDLAHDVSKVLGTALGFRDTLFSLTDGAIRKTNEINAFAARLLNRFW